MSERRDVPGSRTKWSSKHTIDDSDFVYLWGKYILMDSCLILQQDGRLRKDIKITRMETITLELYKNIFIDDRSRLAVLQLQHESSKRARSKIVVLQKNMEVSNYLECKAYFLHKRSHDQMFDVIGNKYSFDKNLILSIGDAHYHMEGNGSSKSILSANKNHERFYFSCQPRQFKGKAVHRLFDQQDISFISDALKSFTKKGQPLFDQWLLMPSAIKGQHSSIHETEEDISAQYSQPREEDVVEIKPQDELRCILGFVKDHPNEEVEGTVKRRLQMLKSLRIRLKEDDEIHLFKELFMLQAQIFFQMAINSRSSTNAAKIETFLNDSHSKILDMLSKSIMQFQNINFEQQRAIRDYSKFDEALLSNQDMIDVMLPSKELLKAYQADYSEGIKYILIYKLETLMNIMQRGNQRPKADDSLVYQIVRKHKMLNRIQDGQYDSNPLLYDHDALQYQQVQLIAGKLGMTSNSLTISHQNLKSIHDELIAHQILHCLNPNLQFFILKLEKFHLANGNQASIKDTEVYLTNFLTNSSFYRPAKWKLHLNFEFCEPAVVLAILTALAKSKRLTNVFELKWEKYHLGKGKKSQQYQLQIRNKILVAFRELLENNSGSLVSLSIDEPLLVSYVPILPKGKRLKIGSPLFVQAVPGKLKCLVSKFANLKHLELDKLDLRQESLVEALFGRQLKSLAITNGKLADGQPLYKIGSSLRYFSLVMTHSPNINFPRLFTSLKDTLYLLLNVSHEAYTLRELVEYLPSGSPLKELTILSQRLMTKQIKAAILKKLPFLEELCCPKIPKKMDRNQNGGQYTYLVEKSQLSSSEDSPERSIRMLFYRSFQ